jgi:hypothetical protein
VCDEIDVMWTNVCCDELVVQLVVRFEKCEAYQYMIIYDLTDEFLMMTDSASVLAIYCICIFMSS